MKKFMKAITAFTLCATMFSSSVTFAAANKATLISSKRITLYPSSAPLRSVDCIVERKDAKEFILHTYDDNGVTIYSLDVEDPAYGEAAQKYINKLTGDPGKDNASTKGGLFPGQSEYHSDTQDEGSARSYAWKRNTTGLWYNNFEGGQSSSWRGSGKAKYIVLNQSITVNGILASISWPPSISGNGSSGSWQSQPISSNYASSGFSGLKVGATAFSCTFIENGDVYVGNHVYRPVTYIKFSYFS